MMNPLPDDFFRQQLEDHARPAPGRAWMRIERRLQKRKAVRWMMAAAALLVVTVALGTWVWRPAVPSKGSAGLTAVEIPEPRQEYPSRQTPSAEKKPIPVAPPGQQGTPGVMESAAASKATNSVRSTSSPDTERFAAREAITTANAAGETTDANQNNVVGEDAAFQRDRTPPFKLVVSVEEVNAKYRNKKNLPNATVHDKEASGIQKLMNHADDLRTNQYPLADLRQMKNEILALNFRNKKHEQNE